MTFSCFFDILKENSEILLANSNRKSALSGKKSDRCATKTSKLFNELIKAYERLKTAGSFQQFNPRGILLEREVLKVFDLGNSFFVFLFFFVCVCMCVFF